MSSAVSVAVNTEVAELTFPVNQSFSVSLSQANTASVYLVIYKEISTTIPTLEANKQKPKSLKPLQNLLNY